MLTCNPLIHVYTFDHSMFIVSNSKEVHFKDIWSNQDLPYLVHAQIQRGGQEVGTPMEHVGPL